MRLALQIDHLRRRLQRRRLVAAACWAITILVATALGLAACDRLLDVGDFLGRTLLTAAFAFACFLVGRHAWISVLNRPVDSMEIARRIERRHPKLHDMVTSALEFSQQARNDPFAGSESLRRAVVIHTSVELEGIDWQQFVPRRPLRRAMSAAAGALLVFGLLNWWAPQSLGIGLTRLLNPWSDSQWPGTQQLKSVEAPPQIKNLQIKVHPPAYTGLPCRPLGKSGRVLARSGLQLSGECDQPLASVELHSERGQKIPATMDPTNKQFHISPNLWRPKASDTFSLKFTTRSAAIYRATPSQRFTLNLIPDPPPQVKIQAPKNNLTVTPAAVVPLIISASDNLAIRNLKLIFSRSDRPDQPEQSILLFQGTKSQSPQQQQLEYLWQLQPLSLQPGTVLEIHARASDYQPSVGQTLHSLRLRVVSEKDLLREISEKDIRLLILLKQLHGEQSELHQLVTQWDQDQRWPEAFRGFIPPAPNHHRTD
ncbi:MAG: hypothetical protein GXP28_09395 [Planctomycetes bacterium]|nr:hypothetical protein [Planctomycetota bacterium]